MTKSLLPPFYLITDDNKLLEQVLPYGVKLVQLRIKNQDLNVIFQEILIAKQLCEKYKARLVINDYWQLAHKAGIKDVHLGQEDLINSDLSILAKANLNIGVSTHNLDELNIALNLPLHISYIALGPIYPTRLKKMNCPPQGLERISQWKKLIGHKALVAIGGLDPTKGRLCLEAGADSVAVVTDISLNADPGVRTQEWLQTTLR